MLASVFALALAVPSLSLDGKPVSPLAFKDAKASVWIFVGTECPISNAYSPEFNRLDREFRGKSVRFYFVYSDPTTKAKDALDHWRSFHLSAPGVMDQKQEMMHLAGASRTPEAAVFDAKGRLVYRGRIDDRWAKLGVSRAQAKTRDLHDVLASILAGKTGKFPFREAVGCYIPTQ